jgi:hypothetical protein
MLTPVEIQTRIEEMIREKFPGEEVYFDLCPEDFKRPSFLVFQQPWEMDLSLGRSMVGLHPIYTVTIFVEVDNYHHSHLIRAGDRAPTVEKIEFGGGFDFDTVTVTLGYTVDRDGFGGEDGGDAPVMEHLTLKSSASLTKNHKGGVL